ncbi:MAG: type II toxin-antitoxin system RelE/ParE family toxin [Parcubacteria group bacterium]|nr:type II toxin-antitoxin system RelE/ParE family toxin [Parcubacteria group bacterium]
MGYDIVFIDKALEDLDKLDEKNLKRILKKIKWFAKQDNPLDFANQLKYDAIGQYRFRIGDYRVICDHGQDQIVVLRIGHRSVIYK